MFIPRSCTFSFLTGTILVTLLSQVAANESSDQGEVQSDKDDAAKVDDISHGLGDHVAWVSLEDGLAQAKEKGKPLMLIIHKSWCGACRSLKPKVKESIELGELSQNFVMVNTMDDDEPMEDIYRPDGGYIPRILYFNPKGELLKEVINEDGNPKYLYYYYDVTSILKSMKKVIATFQGQGQDNTVTKDQDEDANEKIEL